MKLKRFTTYLRSFDKFGEPVKLLYKGEDTYKTKFGAILSIVLNSIVLVYLAKKGLELATKGNSNIQVLEKYTTRSIDDRSYNFEECGFKPVIATVLINEDFTGPTRDVPEKYGSTFVQLADMTIYRPKPVDPE